jgi:hypothetical protein
MKLPTTWPFPQDTTAAPTKETASMAEIDASVAKEPYKRRQKRAEGRKGRDGTESVIKLETLRVRLPNLIEMLIASRLAQKQYLDGVKAVAESTGLLSSTVSRFVRARAGDSFREERMRAEQLSLVFDEIGELDGEALAASAVVEPPLSNEPEKNPIEKAARKKGKQAPLHETDPDNHADPESPLH